MMDARRSAAQPQEVPVKRRVSLVVAAVLPLQEVDFPADAVIFGMNRVQPGISLLVGAPENGTTVKRRVWLVGVGSDVSVEAQNGVFYGEAYLPMDGAPAAPLVPALVFVETQAQAIERLRHRR